MYAGVLCPATPSVCSGSLDTRSSISWRTWTYAPACAAHSLACPPLHRTGDEQKLQEFFKQEAYPPDSEERMHEWIRWFYKEYLQRHIHKYRLYGCSKSMLVCAGPFISIIQAWSQVTRTCSEKCLDSADPMFLHVVTRFSHVPNASAFRRQ